VIVVFGFRRAVPLVTYRPEIALRLDVPELLDEPPDSTTEVRGCRAAAALLMYRPVIALRARPPERLLPLAMMGLLKVPHAAALSSSLRVV
jgi:hypothetical protein